MSKKAGRKRGAGDAAGCARDKRRRGCSGVRGVKGAGDAAGCEGDA